MISTEERSRLTDAIRDAEAGTAGEIVVVVASHASEYRSVPLLWALLAALAAPWPLIAFSALSASRIFLAQLVVAAALCALLPWLARGSALVPGVIKRARAHEAATREFMARGLTRTRERTGVLIYVAMAEHYAEIIADEGIAERVDEAVWRDAVTELIEAIKAGRTAEGLLLTVRRAGTILARHAPPSADDEDELPNKVIVI
jgi:putative membrane protein